MFTQPVSRAAGLSEILSAAFKGLVSLLRNPFCLPDKTNKLSVICLNLNSLNIQKSREHLNKNSRMFLFAAQTGGSKVSAMIYHL